MVYVAIEKVSIPNCFQEGKAGEKATASFCRTPTLLLSVVSKDHGGYRSLRECADRIVSLDTTSIFIIYRHTLVAVGHVRDDRVEQQSWVVRSQESRCFTSYEDIEATGIEDVVIRVRVLIESRVLRLIS